MSKFLLVFLSIFPLLVHAEELDSISKSSILLDEVVVKSFKQDKTFRLAPVSASVVTSRDIADNQIMGIKDFSAFIPNLFIPDYGSKLTAPVYIRGIGSRINSPSVGLYVDDMPYFEKSAFDFDFFEVDRVEVLRGPQGTLYGRNTMGGIINVYTKSPRKYQGTNIHLSQSNYMNLNHSVSHYGKVNDKMGYSVSGNYSHSDGYFTNTFNDKKVDYLDAASARVRLEWELNPRWQMNLISTIDYLDQGGYPYAEYDAEKKKFGEINYNDPSSYRRTMGTSGLNLKYEGEGFTLNSQSSFQYLSDRQAIDQDFTPLRKTFVIQEETQHMFSEEINIKSKNESRYQWLFGTFAFHQSIDRWVNINEGLDQRWYDMPTYGVALYHQSVWNDLLLNGLSLTLGLRYDYEKAECDFTRHLMKGSVLEESGFDNPLEFSQLNPKAALQYTFLSEQMLYASVTRGYKTGGFNTSFDTEDDYTFKPEHSWNYEIGSKLHAFGKRLQADIALFLIDWEDQQISQPLVSKSGSKLKNAGRSESKGVEISLTARPIPALSLQANYGYTKAVFKEYKQSETIDYSGNYIPYIPSSTYQLGADYSWFRPGAGLDKLNFGLNYTGTGKLYWNDKNSLEQGYYGLLNAKISATRRNVTFGIWAKNLTDEKYAAYVFYSGKNFAQRGKPCTFGANIVINL